MKKWAAVLLVITLLILPGCSEPVEEEKTPQANPLTEFDYSVSEQGAAIKAYIGDATTVVIPPEIEGQPVSVIFTCAFADNQTVQKVVVPDSVTLIWNYAFMNCTALEEISLGEGVMEIMDNAFIGCSALTEITLPQSLDKLGYNTFKECT